MSNIGEALTAGILPLVGVGIGAGATLFVQARSSRDSHSRFVAESRHAHQEAIKAALMTYFERAQELQGQLDARERNGQHADLKPFIEQVWLAEKATEIICSDALADRLIAHARALHDVTRDGVAHLDWWPHCQSKQAELIAQAKADLAAQLGY